MANHHGCYSFSRFQLNGRTVFAFFVVGKINKKRLTETILPLVTFSCRKGNDRKATLSDRRKLGLVEVAVFAVGFLPNRFKSYKDLKKSSPGEWLL